MPYGAAVRSAVAFDDPLSESDEHHADFAQLGGECRNQRVRQHTNGRGVREMILGLVRRSNGDVEISRALRGRILSGTLTDVRRDGGAGSQELTR